MPSAATAHDVPPTAPAADVQPLGAHLGKDGSLGSAAEIAAEATARGAQAVQIFLGDPQGWKGPQLPDSVDALRALADQLPVYVHAPYVINVATTNNRIRIPSRKLLEQHASAAASIGARALVVHGGHVSAGDDPAVGFANWRKTVERLDLRLPVLIENTAGGERAMARRLDAIAQLWDAVAAAAASSTDTEIGFCLDTCHFHAGGEELVGIVERVQAITGRIDLVHANDSPDPFGSGRDRHANLGTGAIELDALVAVVQAAQAPVIVETPGGVDGQASDLELLRERLGG